MKLIKKFNVALLGVFLITSCSVTENTEKHCPEDGCLLVRENPNDRFIEEAEESNLESEFEGLEIANEFPYPPEGQSYLKEGLIPRPKKIFSSEGSEGVEVRRLGEIYWIYLESLPSKTWPLMKDYFFENNYELSFEDPEKGEIQAAKDSNKVIVVLEHGIKNNSSEIYLFNEDKTSKDLVDFEDMASYLSENLPGYQGDSIAAQGLNLNKKARIVYVKKEIGIEFKLPFDRTWSALSRAVDKADLEVVDRNRDLKYIQIKLEAQEEGFFTGLFNRDNTDDVEADYELVFSESEGNTILEFKKLSDNEFSVDKLVDIINESLS